MTTIDPPPSQTAWHVGRPGHEAWCLNCGRKQRHHYQPGNRCPTPSLKASIEAASRHRRSEFGQGPILDQCIYCRQSWPCDAARLLRAIEHTEFMRLVKEADRGPE